MSELAWLIEVGHLCVGECNGKIELVTFTDPLAIWFDKESDAKEFVKTEGIKKAKICQHEFVGHE